ncbi:hypothetical protein RB195_026255 [Necator americanus]|uniref:Secreted protein n=1 Tax=Necator americanus TaxID=51031 RepID=A0ABR1EW26_NECAM
MLIQQVTVCATITEQTNHLTMALQLFITIFWMSLLLVRAKDEQRTVQWPLGILRPYKRPVDTFHDYIEPEEHQVLSRSTHDLYTPMWMTTFVKRADESQRFQRNEGTTQNGRPGSHPGVLRFGK